MSRLSGAGTPEADWLPFLDALALPGLALTPVPEHVVVVAPHPDDEVLAVGGLLALLSGAGARVAVVSVTDGGASHPGGSLPPAELIPRRAAETEAALELLGLPPGARRLGLADGGAAALEQLVVEALAVEPGTWLLAPWEGDGHPDHEAVGRACVTVAARDGARLLAYPVWAWHRDAPGEGGLPWDRARRVPLPRPVRAAKAGAIAAFVTQVAPIGPLAADAAVLPPHVLARFARPYEIVFT